jgi:hypothetical protein
LPAPILGRAPESHTRTPHSMHVQYAALCDQVIVGAEGRPSLIGVINDIQIPRFPITLTRITFAARLLFTADEAGSSHRVEVLIRDPAGKEIGRPGGDVSLPTPPPGLDSLAVDIPLQFDFFEITAAGRYTFLLHVDGEAAAGVQLAIRLVAMA